jgi:hypothetical protein
MRKQRRVRDIEAENRRHLTSASVFICGQFVFPAKTVLAADERR